MKEKLIELLLSAEKVADEAGFFNCHKSRPKAELIADYLIENGMIVPLCKVGDTVYEVWKGSIVELQITKIEILKNDFDIYYQTDEWDDDDFFNINNIGKTVFLTKGEAEKKLKEYKGE